MAFLDRFGVRAFNKGPEPELPGRPISGGEMSGPARETKSFALGLNDSLAQILAVSEPGVAHSPAQAMRLYRRTTAISNPINLIAEPFSELHPVLENMDTGEIDRKSPILDLLRRPHPNFSRQLFLEAMAKHYLIAGEAPCVALGNPNRPPVNIVPLNPSQIDVTANQETGMPGHWRVVGMTLTGIYRPAPGDRIKRFMNTNLRELKVIRNFSTRDNSLLRGQSLLVSASRDVRQQIQGDDYNISLLEKGGRTTLLFQFVNSLDPEVFEERKQEIMEQFTGVHQAGKPIVTHGGQLQVSEPSGTKRDMEFGELRKSTEHRIATTYKVPLVLLTTDAATFSNLDAAILMLWDNAIIPLANRLFGEIGEWLLPRYDMDPEEWRLTGDLDRIDAIRGRRNEQLRERKELGLETTDELRESLPGREDVEGGDEILVSSAMTPLSQVAMKIELDESLIGDEPPEDGSDDDDPEPPEEGEGPDDSDASDEEAEGAE